MAERNLLFFIFRLHGGGAERVVSNLSTDFADRFNIRIAVFDRVEKVYPHKGELIHIPLPFSANPAGNNWLIRGLRLWVLTRKLSQLKKEHNIDTTISFGEPANIINALTNRRGKTVLSVRTVLSSQMRNSPQVRILRFFIRSFYNRADRVIVPSRVAGNDLVGHFHLKPEKLKVIYNYLDQEKVNRAAGEAITDPFLCRLFDQPVLLNVGRINPAKGQWLLLEIMARIKEDYPGRKLVIIGEAEKEDHLKEQLIARALQLGLTAYDSTDSTQPQHLEYDVFLLGYQANPYRFMRKSSVLLFPSVFEGFPNTLLEAMQTGLPVISADCHSGPREIMAPETELSRLTAKRENTAYGILCPALPTAAIQDGVAPEIIDEWTAALLSLFNDETLREEMIRNGSRRVKDFDRPHILREWEENMR